MASVTAEDRPTAGINPPRVSLGPARKRHQPLRRLARHRSGTAGVALLLIILALSLAAPLVSPFDPIKNQLSEALRGPSLQHLLGTDNLGRDIFTRLVYGARLSLVIGVAAVLLGVVVGVPLGAISGYYGGIQDLLIQRLVDILLGFPGILLALSLVAILGVGLGNVVVAVGVGSIPAFVRIVRASTLAIRQTALVEAAHCLGAGTTRIIARHVFPNVLGPVLVQATLSIGSTLITAAGLGFLGLGVQPPTPEWGSMLGEGRQYIFSNPNLSTFPGLAIFLTVVAFNLLGDGLRDVLDPRLRL